MTGEEAVVTVAQALEKLGIPYMLSGSFASNFYGVPHSTGDAGFVVQLGGTSPVAIARELGPVFRMDPQMSFEAVTGTTRHVIELAEGAFTVELFLLSDDAHDQERFRRRRRVRIVDREMSVPTAEDVIITKLRWSRHGQRTKDRDDARNVIAVQGDVLDWPYVIRWCDRHGTRELLEDVRRSIPRI